MRIISVSENARLVVEKGIEENLSQAAISIEDLDWLVRLYSRVPEFGRLEDRQTFKLEGLVGVAPLPGGRQLEILPKIADCECEVEKSRRLLCKMLGALMDTTSYEAGEASIEMFRMPLTAWVMEQFLLQLNRLFQTGLRFSYSRRDDKKPFIRGQLQVGRQLRELPHRLHLFNIRHDIFSPDRPENRLLKSALVKIEKNLPAGRNWRRTGKFLQYMEMIPESVNIREDFERWGEHRLMAGYAPIRPWCRLVLGHEMPFAITGPQMGISFLFSMPRLFEKYLAKKLQGLVVPGSRLHIQKGDRHLCHFDDKNHFALRPDMLVERGDGQKVVLDAKWKRLENEDLPEKNDVAQLYIYGQRYLQGRGRVGLVYPRHEKFPAFGAPIKFHDSELCLHILNYDLEKDRLNADPSFPMKEWFRDLS